MPTNHFTSHKYYPWLVVFLGALFLIYKYILQVAPGIMTDELMREFHIHGVGLGNLAATFFYAYFIMQLFVGVLLDKYSARYLTTLAIALCAIGTFTFATTDHLIVAELARSLIGVGVAFATVSYMKMVAIWFKPHQFAFVGGLLATAAMLGAVFGEAPLSLLVDAIGWQHSLMLCALLGVIIAVIYFLLVRDHRPEQTNDAQTIVKHGFTLKDVLEVLKTKQNWLLTFYSGLAFTPVAVFGGLWGVPFLEVAYHLQTTDAATLVSCVFIGLAVGGPVLGLLSDRLADRLVIMKFSALFAFITLLPVIYNHGLPLCLISILLFLFCFTTGAFMLGFALGRESNKLVLAATIIAMINTGDGIFGSFTEPLIGKFLDLGWDGTVVNGVHHFALDNYHRALMLLPLYLLVAFILLFFIREPKESR